jgi:hypothetical protein
MREHDPEDREAPYSFLDDAMPRLVEQHAISAVGLYRPDCRKRSE